MAHRQRLGQMLLDAGVLTPRQLEDALTVQRISGGRLGSNLMQLGLLSEEVLLRFLGEQYHLPTVPWRQVAAIPPEARDAVPGELAAKALAIPLRKDESTLDLALADPDNLAALDEVAFHTGLKIRPFLASELAVRAALARHYGITGRPRSVELVEPSSPEVPIIERFERFAEEDGELDAFALDDAILRMERATDAHQVVEILRNFCAEAFEACILFACRPGTYEAITGIGRDGARVPGLRIPRDQPSMLQVVHGARRSYLGHAGQGALDEVILRSLGMEPGGPLFLAPVVFEEQVRLILLGAGVKPGFRARHLEPIQRLLAKTGLALRIISLRRLLRAAPVDPAPTPTRRAPPAAAPRPELR